MRTPLILAIAAALSGCADSHQWTPQPSGTTHLSATDRVYISVPADGAYGSEVYSGSGRNTAQIIYASFARYSKAARVGHDALDFDEALEAARHGGQDYLILPTIMHWEDRATEWSMIPDRAEVKIEVVRVLSGEVISSGIAKGKSGLATFGGDHPQDLLPEPIEAFVSTLY